MKKWIIISSIIAIIIMIGSPFVIYSEVKSDTQWIGFHASYLGGIFGGIVSGCLTLGGVYLTIQHQNKLLNKEKAEIVSYVYAELTPKFWSLNEFVENRKQLSDDELIEKVQSYANHFLEVIDENKHIIESESDFKLISRIKSVNRWLEEIANYNHDKPNHRIIDDFERINTFIQQQFKMLHEYERSLH